jgi:hypothetical protein
LAHSNKAHPLRWLSGFLLAVGAWGIGTGHWGAALFGFCGIITIVLFWISFKWRVKCDVKNLTKPGFCKRETNGILYGCKQDHGPEKLAAWSRFFGTGYLFHVLNLPPLPYMKSQAVRVEPKLVDAKPILSFGDISEKSEASVTGAAIPSHPEPTGFQQIFVVYCTGISTAGTLAGVVIGILQIRQG